MNARELEINLRELIKNKIAISYDLGPSRNR